MTDEVVCICGARGRERCRKGCPAWARRLEEERQREEDGLEIRWDEIEEREKR